MLTACAESFVGCLDELLPLFDGHWETLALDKEIPLAPSYVRYGNLEAAGELLFIALRDNGKLVGYWTALIAPGLHYEMCLTAQMDMWNILPEYESGVASLILMRAVHREYQRRGVRRAFAGEKIHKPCGRLYRMFGYEPVETLYSRMIGE